MNYSDKFVFKVYEIDKGNLDIFVRFEEGTSNIKKIESLLHAYKKLSEYLSFSQEKKIEETSLLEIWQVPIPFSRTLAYATLFRMNPYDKAYLVSPVRMDWLENERGYPLT